MRREQRFGRPDAAPDALVTFRHRERARWQAGRADGIIDPGPTQSRRRRTVIRGSDVPDAPVSQLQQMLGAIRAPRLAVAVETPARAATSTIVAVTAQISVSGTVRRSR